MRTLLAALAIALALTLVVSDTARAQEGDPPANAGDRAGVVFGQLTNGTPGGETPGSLALMLHAWDEAGETVMLDGTADAAGAFRFENVPLQDGWTFAAMGAYNDVTYFSDFVPVLAGATELPLPFVVYETTTATAAVRISQLHTFLEFVAGEISVTEVYVLSNLGDRAVTGGVALPDGRAATLQFALPAGANKVSFKGNDSTARFVVTADGFADIEPLLPGEASGQILVTYSLPYQTGMTIAHGLPYPVESLNLLHRAEAGVTVSGEGLNAPTEQEMGEGQRYTLYEGAAQPAGASLELTLAGRPDFLPAPPVAPAEPSTAGESPASDPAGVVEQLALPVSGAVFGLALLAAGVWWLRRNRAAELEPETISDGDTNDWDGLVRTIALLDDAHERGEVSDGDYAERRSALKAQARALLAAEEAAP